MKITKSDLMSVFCYIAISSLNLGFRRHYEFISAFNWTILIGCIIIFIALLYLEQKQEQSKGAKLK